MQSDLNVPILETPRLILRGHRPEDFAAYLAMSADPVVRAHFRSEFSREDTWGRFLRIFGLWSVLGVGPWAIEEKDTRAYIGNAGLFDMMRDIFPPLDSMLEAGWTLAASFHGKGYATEAVQAILKWAQAHRPETVCCLIRPANTASKRVAEKCGFGYVRDVMYKDAPTQLFVRASGVSQT